MYVHLLHSITPKVLSYYKTSLKSRLSSPKPQPATDNVPMVPKYGCLTTFLLRLRPKNCQGKFSWPYRQQTAVRPAWKSPAETPVQKRWVGDRTHRTVVMQLVCKAAPRRPSLTPPEEQFLTAAPHGLDTVGHHSVSVKRHTWAMIGSLLGQLSVKSLRAGIILSHSFPFLSCQGWALLFWLQPSELSCISCEPLAFLCNVGTQDFVSSTQTFLQGHLGHRRRHTDHTGQCLSKKAEVAILGDILDGTLPSKQVCSPVTNCEVWVSVGLSKCD